MYILFGWHNVTKKEREGGSIGRSSAARKRKWRRRRNDKRRGRNSKRTH